MTKSYSLEGADRVTVGTSDITMRIWLLVDEAGEDGLSRDEIITAVAPHVNAGHARRRYLKQREANYRYRRDIVGSAVSIISPSWEDTGVEAARRYAVGLTIGNMRRVGSLVLLGADRFKTGRKPRYKRDERAIDLTGDRTRLHMNGTEALRVLEPALERHRGSPRARMTAREWVALERLVGLFRDELRAGFPNVP